MARMLFLVMLCASGCAQWSWMNQVRHSWEPRSIVSPHEFDVYDQQQMAIAEKWELNNERINQ